MTKNFLKSSEILADETTIWGKSHTKKCNLPIFSTQQNNFLQ